MKLALSSLSALTLVLAAPAPVAPSAPADFSFREPPLNSRGVKGMSDLRGKPIVIDFWGKN